MYAPENPAPDKLYRLFERQAADVACELHIAPEDPRYPNLMALLTRVFLSDKTREEQSAFEYGRRHNDAQTNAAVVYQLSLANKAIKDAQIDELTGIPTMKALEKEIERAIHEKARRPDRSALIAVADLEGLHPMNDTYGRSAGDLLIQVTALALQSSLRATDDCGRWGTAADEFVMLFRDAKPEFKDQIMEKIRKNCRPIKLTMAILEIESGQTLEQVKEALGLALAHAKAARPPKKRDAPLEYSHIDIMNLQQALTDGTAAAVPAVAEDMAFEL